MKTIIFQSSTFSKTPYISSNNESIEWKIGAQSHHALDYFEPIKIHVPLKVQLKGHLKFNCIDPPNIFGTYMIEGISPPNHPVAIYGASLLTNIEWKIDETALPSDCTFTPVQTSIYFAYQTRDVTTTRTLTSDLFIETQSLQKPAFAWGGVYKEGYTLQQIYPAYFALTCKPGVTHIEFFKSVDPSTHLFIGDNHPNISLWGQTPCSLHQYITRGGLQIKLTSSSWGEHLYTSGDVIAYDHGTHEIQLYFTLHT